MLVASGLTRSTPFRLAVTFATFLIAAFLLSGLVVYQIVSAELNDRVDEDLQKTFSLLSAAYGKDDLEDLISSVSSYADLSVGNEQLFSLVGSDGQPLAGTSAIRGFVAPLGFSNVAAGSLGLGGDVAYRVYSGKIGPNKLSIAYSNDDTDELKQLVLSSFAWAMIIAAALAVSGGALLAARVQHRLNTIAQTMDEVSRGSLGSRIPLVGNRDDIDAVASQVNAALDRLVALMEGLRQVGFDIAHDLRTPLNRLRITLESALEKADTPEIIADLEEARSDIDKTTQTFDALLRIAQIEAGARKSRFQLLDLSEIVADIGEIYGEVAVDQNKTLVSRAEPGNMVHGDRELLVQLLANLVENALRHTPAGVAIKVSCQNLEGRKVIYVEDNGAGIPADEREKAFRRLYRLDASRSTPGSGLGLSMAKAIAELHGAHISLEDAEPGLRVTIVFTS